MIKIFLTVRNRLAITKKCIESLKKHSELPHQIYVYNNQTTFLLKEHFDYFYELYNQKMISNISFTSDESNFNAFSKAVSCNNFGHHHEEDPQKDSYNFLLFLDNDMIVAPDWDKTLSAAWNYVTKNGMKHIKIIGQLPGGMKGLKDNIELNKNLSGYTGSLGGSAFWSVRPTFFREVGFLDLKNLVGCSKKHDQHYWPKLSKSADGKPYMLGLKTRLAFHCGYLAGSVCNRLTKLKVPDSKQKEEVIKFEANEEEIDKLNFEEFYDKINKEKNDW